MDQATILQKLASAGGKVAGVTGGAWSQYRPEGTMNPISPANLIATIQAYLTPVEAIQQRPEWFASLDFSTTAPGDYLVGTGGVTYFIAAQIPLAPIVCVRTNVVLSLRRPNGVNAIASTGYCGVYEASLITYAQGWPAYGVISGRAKQGETEDDEGLGGWEFWLPALAAMPEAADVIVDNMNRIFVVTSAAVTSYGMLLRAKQASN